MKKLLAVGALLAVSAAHAQLAYTGGTQTPFVGDYSAPPVLTPDFAEGLVDPTIWSLGDNPLRVTFLGKEAAHIDQFILNGSLVLDNLASAPTSYGPFALSAGALDFKFKDTSDGSEVPNGGNLLAFASYAVLGSFDEAGAFTPWAGYSGEFQYVIGFNDGAKVDADYDDLVIGITAIPEPETYALMLAGLAAVGFMARRRKVQ